MYKLLFIVWLIKELKRVHQNLHRRNTICLKQNMQLFQLIIIMLLNTHRQHRMGNGNGKKRYWQDDRERKSRCGTLHPAVIGGIPTKNSTRSYGQGDKG